MPTVGPPLQRPPKDSSGSKVGSRLLFANSKLSPVRNIAARLLLAFGAILVTALLVFFEKDCYADRGVTGTVTLLDSLYYATVSLSTTGYGDIVPVCDSSRLANILIITPLRFLFLIVLVGTTVEVLTQRTRQEWRINRWRKHVENHTVIVGFGVKGRSAARTIVDSGVNASTIVVVTNDHHAAEEAARLGYVGVVGDARREEILKDAEIERAARIIIAVDADDACVLVTLTVRRLAPQATIVVAARESVNADILRQSGANIVIPTAESAGHLMALSLISPVAGEIMEDLLDDTRGLNISERDITREELGMMPSQLEVAGQLVLAVVRGGQVTRFDEQLDALQLGDRLVVIASMRPRS
jgi:voltage-gated potassium channel